MGRNREAASELAGIVKAVSCAESSFNTFEVRLVVFFVADNKRK